MTQHKPKLSFWQIWNMSFGFLGIQFGFELQNSNVSRIFETLGANKDDIPILWIAAPLTGLLVQPIIGYLSDRTWHPYWGRRRPYFFIGAILATIALLIMPNSPSLWVAGGMLWIMDASINISMEPFRAFVGDKLNPNQRTAGFAMQSFFIGTGSVVAALLPWIFTNWFDLSNDSTSGIPEAVKWSFYAGAFAFFTAVMYTVFTTKEFPPESIEKLREENKRMSFLSGLRESYEGILHMPKTMKQLAWVQFFTWFALFSMWIYSTNAVTSNIYDMKIPRDLYTKLVDDFHANRASTLTPKELGGITQDMNEIEKFQADAQNVTLTVNLANEFLKSRNLVTADKNTLIRVQAEYNTGANWLGVCSSIRNGVAAVFAFIIPLIAIRLGRKRTHMISLVIGGLGLVSLNFVSNPNSIAFSMALVGIAWASILSMPYAMLAGSLPPNKMGYFMGVFNFFIVIPQILAATILGFLTMNLFEGNTMLTITLGGLMMIVAGLLCLRVDDN